MFYFGLMAAFVGSFLAAWAANWVGLIPWRRSAGAHWTERARALFPVWCSARFNRIYLVVNTVFLLQYVGGDMVRHWVATAIVAWRRACSLITLARPRPMPSTWTVIISISLMMVLLIALLVKYTPEGLARNMGLN